MGGFFVIGAHVDEAPKVDADGRDRKGRHAAARRVARHEDVPRLLLGPAPVKRDVGRVAVHEGLNLANVKRLFGAVGADPEGFPQPCATTTSANVRQQTTNGKTCVTAHIIPGSSAKSWRTTSTLALESHRGMLAIL